MQTVVPIFAGFMYDTLGRRLTIFIGFTIMMLAYIWIPRAAPNIVSLSFARALLGTGMQILLGNPLTNDYIKKETRGIATTL